ncbi:unnamed protein product [Amoebophrya sp. A25]|nr:unnamed protein product [Amoebophrya sp. A25]|eukprot:GSA25T00020160001.1
MATGRQQQAGIGLGIVGDGRGWSGAATRSDGLANRSDKINRLRPQVFFDIGVVGLETGGGPRGIYSGSSGIVIGGDDDVGAAGAVVDRTKNAKTGATIGRVVFELFQDVCPRTAENFRQLCVGLHSSRVTRKKQKPMCFRNTLFHRIVPDFCIQGGDLDLLSGRGGESIYGPSFDDENFQVKHDKPFLLSMANSGRNTNASQFFITSKATPSLDGKHVVFGEVISGMDVVLKLEGYGTRNGKPSRECLIVDCGEITDTAAYKFRALQATKQTKEEKFLDAAGNPLPANWFKVESRSKPGLFYYQHKHTGTTQFDIPVASTETGKRPRYDYHDDGDQSGSTAVVKRSRTDHDRQGGSGAVVSASSSGKKAGVSTLMNSDRACRGSDEIRILIFEKRHRDFFGKASKSWRQKEINLTQEEARQKLSTLREKFQNAEIGGGITALKTKWLNMSTMENDCDKQYWVLGPIRKGQLTAVFDKKVEEEAFKLKKGDLSEVFAIFNAQVILFRLE